MVKTTNGTGRTPSAETYEGYIVDLMDHLAKLLGFSYRLEPVWTQSSAAEVEMGSGRAWLGNLSSG